MGYTAKQINIGDQVFFNSTQGLSNHDLFWRVVEKKGSKLVIELKKYIWNEDSMIDITEVKGVLKTLKQLNSKLNYKRYRGV